MTISIAIPVFRVSCTAFIDKGRGWSAVDELLLWALTRRPGTLGELAEESWLPYQVVVASVARMMRFRLVEVTLASGSAAFRASDYGLGVVRNGETLPYFPKRLKRRVRFVVERLSDGLFIARDGIRVLSQRDIELERRSGTQVRTVLVEGGPPAPDHAAAFNRLSEVVARGWDEQLAGVDGLTATFRDDEYMVVGVVDGIARGLPEGASDALRSIVSEIAALEANTVQVSVPYAGSGEKGGPESKTISCAFAAEDLIVGGAAHKACLTHLLGEAHERAIVHSTFLDAAKFADLVPVVRAACAKGVAIDILWGASKEEPDERNAVAATKITEMVRNDPVMNNRIRVHLRSTGSHAKMLLVDQADGSWVAAVGSCNWLSSPFRAVELSAVLRDPYIVAEVAAVMQRIAGRRGLSNSIATELAITSRDLRRRRSTEGPARISIVVGETHDRLMRQASGSARSRLVVGSNRLGSTAMPGALLPSEYAARAGITPIVLYTRPSGPIKTRHARELAKEVEANGVTLLGTEDVPLHGKFLAWDDDDLVVTSFNWASASSGVDNPWNEVGVHINAQGIAKSALATLATVFPGLQAA